jgi:hypothetical protein
MAMRSRTTFKKRQKELARQEKQRDKAAKRLQRKIDKNSPDSGEESPEDGEDVLEGEGEDALEEVTPASEHGTEP